MNYRQHNGTVTGDTSAQICAYCNLMDGSVANLMDGSIAPLDAPDWLNTGRMVTTQSGDGTQVQFQQHCLRG